ncbi:MAG: bifunctional 4-hydroxy-2-oxoglutarate aldolase/2-dehydro-3-deoxy-phosphogluconate aldolase [Verrucomicrobiota bacterium]|nr:bifunctional 4-hydroxy-2-oxoglutarate aldolase/2-dehydro-3-deoxy-phosphogluconate aldolase [Verrucomicrobiota bacterium]
MRPRDEVVQGLTNPGVIAVVRAQTRQQVLPLTEALLAGGIRAIEITLTTPEPFQAIEEARRRFEPDALIGAGTVLTPDQCRAVLGSGAEFVVTPLARPDFVPVIYTAGAVSVIGAFTPTEAQWAHEAGADFIKLFPAEILGPGFVRSVRAPMPHLKFIPTGGVTVENLATWFEAGCPAVGVGSALVSADILAANNWAELKRRAAAYAQAARAARPPS